MRKVILALAPLGLLASAASAQTVEERTVVQHPDGTVSRTIVQRDNGADERRTVVRTENDGDRGRYDGPRDGDRRDEYRRDGDHRDEYRGDRDRREEYRREEYRRDGDRPVVQQRVFRQVVRQRVVRRATPKVVRQCRTVWRNHTRVQTCTVVRTRY